MVAHVMSPPVHDLRDVPGVARDLLLGDLDTGRQVPVLSAVIRARHSSGAPHHAHQARAPPLTADFHLLPGTDIALSARPAALVDVHRVLGLRKDHAHTVGDVPLKPIWAPRPCLPARPLVLDLLLWNRLDEVVVPIDGTPANRPGREIFRLLRCHLHPLFSCLSLPMGPI
jgi:hypothetical protein